jgi:hypothetical protein
MHRGEVKRALLRLGQPSGHILNQSCFANQPFPVGRGDEPGGGPQLSIDELSPVHCRRARNVLIASVVAVSANCKLVARRLASITESRWPVVTSW